MVPVCPCSSRTPSPDMGTLAFDTHKAVEGLKDAGFEEAQAEPS